eukprot:CAMPEP_0113469024 /NCGR_PEP_ID=MMETSP0014_2-20120614/15676_1 /TAXON_ID=2857 /ORGANISM="Nitzschia sp." /LENGTH=374 /DNA_ID=CAMNT_0000361469 /DNA_START=1226 /DNA_END=2352 /DNA_ORIENTATION=- /assembly_acc=CAM_ASM_000159
MTEDSTNNKNSTQGEETTPSFSPSLLQSNPESQAANKQRSQVGILRVVGPDAKGLLAAFSQTLYGHGCGIVESEQHTDHEAKKFFQRLKFDYSTMHTDRNALEVGIREVSDRLNMTTSLNWNEHPKKIAIMVSKYDHALWELLLRHQGGELDSEVSCIISNHPDLKYIADAFKIPFHLFKVTKATKASVEEEELKLLKQTYRVDLVILARYMQIVSDDFCSQFQHQVINIHHSFLPAFIGSKPYHRAYDRGVKLIGATPITQQVGLSRRRGHYQRTIAASSKYLIHSSFLFTFYIVADIDNDIMHHFAFALSVADLDEGPIIEQDIMRISHRDAVPDLIAKGRILEKNVLVTAVKAHLEDRIIVFDNKCVVFDG